jgi:hypothetical protein
MWRRATFVHYNEGERSAMLDVGKNRIRLRKTSIDDIQPASEIEMVREMNAYGQVTETNIVDATDDDTTDEEDNVSEATHPDSQAEEQPSRKRKARDGEEEQPMQPAQTSNRKQPRVDFAEHLENVRFIRQEWHGDTWTELNHHEEIRCGANCPCCRAMSRIQNQEEWTLGCCNECMERFTPASEEKEEPVKMDSEPEDDNNYGDVPRPYETQVDHRWPMAIVQRENEDGSTNRHVALRTPQGKYVLLARTKSRKTRGAATRKCLPIWWRLGSEAELCRPTQPGRDWRLFIIEVGGGWWTEEEELDCWLDERWTISARQHQQLSDKLGKTA